MYQPPLQSSRVSLNPTMLLYGLSLVLPCAVQINRSSLLGLGSAISVASDQSTLMQPSQVAQQLQEQNEQEGLAPDTAGDEEDPVRARTAVAAVAAACGAVGVTRRIASGETACTLRQLDCCNGMPLHWGWQLCNCHAMPCHCYSCWTCTQHASVGSACRLVTSFYRMSSSPPQRATPVLLCH